MEPMRAEDAEALLHTSHFGIFAMGRDGDAYAVPLYFAYDGEHVWFHCHPGLNHVTLTPSHIEAMQSAFKSE